MKEANNIHAKKIIQLFITALALSLVLISALYPSAAQADTVFDGAGTKDNPYIISTKDDLSELAIQVNNGNSFNNCYFKQVANINLNGIEWTPIGISSDAPFSGIYDGQGYSIEEIECVQNIDQSTNSGLFGFVNGSIANVVIKSGKLKGTYAGGIAAQSLGDDAVIANCINYATINGKYAGGIAGSFYRGTISTCINFGKIEGTCSSGTAGETNDVKIYRCYSTTAKVSPEGVNSFESFNINKNECASKTLIAKLSIASSLAQYLFLGNSDLTLLGWKQLDKTITLGPAGWLPFIVSIINEYTFAALGSLWLILICRKLHKENNSKTSNSENERSYNLTRLIIIGCILFFLDTYILLRPPEKLTLGIILTILVFHLVAIVLVRQRLKFTPIFKNPKIDRYTIIALIIIAFLELLQFSDVPHFDANIYYASFARGCRDFNYDLITFIGAFNCWKWAQGVAIFAAPFELLFPGKAVGVYISNLIISLITIIVMNKLLKLIYKNIPNSMAMLCCLVFTFSPYILGLFTYFTFEWHLAHYVVWLTYAIAKRDNLMISFCGLLLALTKATGIAFYIAAITVMGISYIYKSCVRKGKCENKQNLLKITVYWAMPIIIFLFLLKFGNDLTIQSFYESYIPSSFLNLGDKNQIANSILHSFIFGFRWLLLALIVIGAIRIFYKKEEVFNKDCSDIILSVVAGVLAVVLLLCIYRSDANCPRYTSILSAPYAILLPIFLLTISKRIIKNILTTSLTILFGIQTYWTIDPSIIGYCRSVETGTTKMYRIAYNGDTRKGMNYTSGYDGEYPLICDLYTYNYQHTMYSGLISNTLSDIKLNTDARVYCLNVGAYEIDLSGRGYGDYNIYYHKETNKRDYSDDGGVVIPFHTLLYNKEQGFQKEVEDTLPDTFYLLVPYRAYSDDAISALESLGYRINKETVERTAYGEMKIYEFNSETEGRK